MIKHEFKNIYAPGEARTHGLQIMRLTRCLLRYGGLVVWTRQNCKKVAKTEESFEFIFFFFRAHSRVKLSTPLT